MASFAHSPDEELFEACTRNDAEAVLRAIARGANPRGSGSNAEPPPLHLCALKGSDLAMSVLLQHGVDFEAKDADGNRALHQAALAPTDEVIALLIDARATVDPKNADGETPLFLAARKRRTMTVQALLEYGASHAARTELGATPLMACADKGHVQVAQLLLASNADPNAADNFGMTALHWSSHSGHLELAQLLVDAGASMTVRDVRIATHAYVVWCGFCSRHLLCLIHASDSCSGPSASVLFCAVLFCSLLFCSEMLVGVNDTVPNSIDSRRSQERCCSRRYSEDSYVARRRCRPCKWATKLINLSPSDVRACVRPP